MHSILSMKSIKENKFKVTGHLSDLHKRDGILRMSQKKTEAMRGHVNSPDAKFVILGPQRH